MKVISFMNFKGGSAKTTTTLQVGKGLEHQGYKVLYLDLDIQGNLSMAFNNDLKISIGDVLLGDNTIDESIKDNIVRHEPNLINIESKLNPSDLKDALKNIKAKYDFALIDTSPYRSNLSINSLAASDYVVAPTELELSSIMGLDRLKEYIDYVKENFNPKLNFLGILINRYNPRLSKTKELEPQLIELAQSYNTKVFDTKIRRDSSLIRCSLGYDDIYLKPKSHCCIDYTSLVDEILKMIKMSTKKQ